MTTNEKKTSFAPSTELEKNPIQICDQYEPIPVLANQVSS